MCNVSRGTGRLAAVQSVACACACACACAYACACWSLSLSAADHHLPPTVGWAGWAGWAGWDDGLASLGRQKSASWGPFS